MFYEQNHEKVTIVVSPCKYMHRWSPNTRVPLCLHTRGRMNGVEEEETCEPTCFCFGLRCVDTRQNTVKHFWRTEIKMYLRVSCHILMLHLKNSPFACFVSCNKMLAHRFKRCVTGISGICLVVMLVLLMLEIRNDNGVIFYETPALVWMLLRENAFVHCENNLCIYWVIRVQYSYSDTISTLAVEPC